MWPRKCAESRNISKSVPNLFSSTNFSRMKLFYYNITFFNNVIISKYFVSNITQSGPFFSFIVIWYRPFDNNDIRDRRPFHPGTGISSARITLSHIRGCKPLSEPLAHWANLSLLSVSRYLTIPWQHLSVSSKESLYKHTKALFAKFLFKFADKTASSSISSWVKTCWSDSVWKAILKSKLNRLLLCCLNFESFHHQSLFCCSLLMINQSRGGGESRTRL